MNGTVRRARPDDVPEILRLVRELATYEREPDAVHATEADLHEALFGPAPAVFAHVADAPDDIPDGGLDGMALWYLSFSSWEGRHGIHLHDLYVTPARRGSGLGTALLAALAAVAVERGYPRLEWDVLDWNEPALTFYRGIGAARLDGWHTQRLSGTALADLAARATSTQT